MNASKILKHMSSTTQKGVCRYIQTLSPLNHQAMTVRGTTPPLEDMLRLWGKLQQDNLSTTQTSHNLDTFNSMVSDKTIKGTKESEIFGKRLTSENPRLNRQPVFGDLMVIQEPSMLKPTPTLIPITTKKCLLQCLKRQRFKRNGENLKQFLF
ncbi:uncharacterized protein LOC110454621 isoform X2 [Mizuhopecten yessoensis]|uniref:uncharacterized protein LOC110454621 isoform X2 n=1 Tax=Mizuhopecten yessoensis TaxID=6573 RepID=UPI000B457911|nr:uncharacterized protein LOC110454621 isoform X2 [Mizuhopecten yessoensis]